MSITGYSGFVQNGSGTFLPLATLVVVPICLCLQLFWHMSTSGYNDLVHVFLCLQWFGTCLPLVELVHNDDQSLAGVHLLSLI
jgi:hypothetical protein